MSTIRPHPRICWRHLAAIGLVCFSLAAGIRAQQEPPPNTPPSSTSQPTEATTSQPAMKAEDPEPMAGDGRRDPEPRREPSPTEILRELTRQAQSPKPVLRPSRPDQVERTLVNQASLPANAIATPKQRLLPDGYRLVDRPGRLTREGDYWVFSFEDRGQAAPQLPIRLLPNRLLEDMEQFSEGGLKPAVFVVSGEVTEYHSVNYLLVQKLLTRPDLGNLK